MIDLNCTGLPHASQTVITLNLRAIRVQTACVIVASSEAAEPPDEGRWSPASHCSWLLPARVCQAGWAGCCGNTRNRSSASPWLAARRAFLLHVVTGPSDSFCLRGSLLHDFMHHLCFLGSGKFNVLPIYFSTV